MAKCDFCDKPAEYNLEGKHYCEFHFKKYILERQLPTESQVCMPRMYCPRCER